MLFEGLRETLLIAGIAPRHVRRYLRELDDHLADLTEAQRAAGHDEEEAALRARALLGGDTELAAAMLAQPGLKSLPARAPWLFFGPLPVLAIFAGFFIAGLPLVLIARVHGWMGHDHMAAPGWFQSLAYITALFANLALGPGLAALLAAAAWHQRLDWKWPVLAIAILALIGMHMTAHFPPPGQRGGEIGIALIGEAWYLAPHPAPEASILLAQFVLTLAPAFWLLRKRRLRSA
ncbi:MAG TPA: hypothetical protein VNW15_08955 [Rhizomicrobium sp.]|nr:hypothetical protein [Rhizomicrobium sp.]